MDDRVRAALVESVEARLRARGSHDGPVGLEDDTLVIGQGARSRRVPVSELLGAWNLLPPPDRARRIDAALTRAGVAVVGPSAARGRLVAAWALAALLVLLALASVVWARGEATSAEQRALARAAPPPAPSGEPAAAAARTQTMCSAVRKRVLAGASLGPYDAEGWVVELWLAREDGALGPTHPQLQPLAKQGGLAPLDAELAAIRGTIVLGELGPPPGADPTMRPGGALVTLGGGFATAFVDPAQRARFGQLADRLYDASSADMGGLWARCGELPWHDLGAWYRGRDRGAAAGAMLFTAGRYGEGGAVHGTAPSGAANTLGALVARSRQVVDERSLELTVTELGGHVRTMPGAGTTISFPLGGTTLATRSSRDLAALLDRAAP